MVRVPLSILISYGFTTSFLGVGVTFPTLVRELVLGVLESYEEGLLIIDLLVTSGCDTTDSFLAFSFIIHSVILLSEALFRVFLLGAGSNGVF